MTRIYTPIHIGKPVGQVFEYVTTAGNWPEWHPSSLGVQGAIDHSAVPGEQITEAFLVAGRRGSVVWTVLERAAPNRWVIDGRITGRSNGGRITYTLTPQPDGTFFEREFVYPTTNPVFALLDWLIVRQRVEAESVEALRRLRQALESH